MKIHSHYVLTLCVDIVYSKGVSYLTFTIKPFDGKARVTKEQKRGVKMGILETGLLMVVLSIPTGFFIRIISR